MTVVPVEKIDARIDGLSADPGRICFLGCLVNIARYVRVPLTEELLLGAAIGVRFRFGRIRPIDPQRQRAIDATIEINSCDLHSDGERVSAFCRRRGLRIDGWTYATAEELSAQASDEIRAGRPVLLLVNSAHLPYWPKDSRANNGHYLVCHGWSPAQASVIDAFVPSSRQQVYMGDVPMDAMMRALDCEGFIGTPYYGAWTFTPLATREALTAEEVATTLHESAREMLDGRAETIAYGGLEVDFRMGLAGIDALRDELARSSASDAAESVLREIFPLISSFGGPARARAVLADFLSGPAAAIGLQIPDRVAADCVALSRSWKTFANLVLKIAYGGGETVTARATQHLGDIRERERELAVQLVRAVSR